MKLAVIGSGHAGVEAAATAAAAGHAVTLLSDENCLPYYRPALVAGAFGAYSDDRLWMHTLKRQSTAFMPAATSRKREPRLAAPPPKPPDKGGWPDGTPECMARPLNGRCMRICQQTYLDAVKRDASYEQWHHELRHIKCYRSQRGG